MRIRSTKAALAYRIALVLLSLWGLLLSAHVFSGAPDFFSFRYYTILSNLLCFLYFLGLVIGMLRKPQSYASHWYASRLKGAVTMAITVTMLIYQFMLTDTPFSMSARDGALQDTFTHLIVPVMVIADWLLFDPKGAFRSYDPVLWLSVPIVYLLYALIAAPLGVTYHGGSRYPYFFIDVDTLGWAGVFRMVGLLALGFLSLGYLIWAIDKGMARFKKEKTV